MNQKTVECLYINIKVNFTARNIEGIKKVILQLKVANSYRGYNLKHSCT